jgi:DNA-directed RNA polymerase specialized sigma24 family protein
MYKAAEMNDKSSRNKFRESEVTAWIQSLETGDEEATSQLWSYCFPRLLRYTGKKLPEHLRRALDEEDVALSAFKSFCLAASKGSFPQLSGRDDLWKLLLHIARKKANSYIRHELREKRGGGKVRGESIFNSADDPNDQQGIDNVEGEAVSPDLLAQFTDDCRNLLDMLGDDILKTIALLRMEGHSVDEIAERVGCAKRSVERRLNLIRRTWMEKSEDEINETPKTK